ncbi:MAG: Sua5/YciO/YrdC/YwlC family protein, partial [Bacilli bacterium]|nr:Sua5/YciO/YrdC/YwlC family protein [Bacilli bacterium]
QPLLVTSANHSGEPTSTSFEETLHAFDGEVAGIVKGDCASKLASTIVNIVSDDAIRLVREGPISFSEIKKVWEEKS